MINRQLMRPGQWSIPLRTDTPRRILDQLEINGSDPYAFGHIVVTPADFDPADTSEATLLGASSYMGVYRTQEDRHVLSGSGLEFWLGDEDGKGSAIQVWPGGKTQTFAAWVGDCIPSWMSGGSVEAITGNVTWEDPQAASHMDKLEYICRYKGAEWRIDRTDLTVDAGTVTYLYPNDPIAVFGAIGRGGQEPGGLRGVRGTVRHTAHAEDYYTAVYVFDGSSIGSASRGTVPFYNGDGSQLQQFRNVRDSTPTPITLSAQATAWLLYDGYVRDIYSIAGVEAFDPVHEFGDVGESVYLFDPARDILSVSNKKVYRGEQIYPDKQRIVGLSWPVRRGMGVYFRWYNSATFQHEYLWLTRWVDWSAEQGEVSIDVGAPPLEWGQALRARYTDWSS